jgi:acetoin utilization protein AcuC
VTDTLAFFYDERFLKYDFGSYHPLHQDRILLHYELCKSLGLLSKKGVNEPSFELASEKHLQYAHTQDYIDQIRTLSQQEGYSPLDRGDTRAFPGAYDISRVMVGASLAAVDVVMQGHVNHSWNPGGGMHHAHADRASGFCIFNDAAIACHHLKRRYKLKRILYLDIDVHHGDGVEEQFYSDPEVFTLSIHQTGRTLFPQTGYPHEIGDGEGRGYTANLPLPPYTQDDQYLAAFEAIVPPLIKAYKPEAIVMQSGVDTHFKDEIAHLILTTHAFTQISRRMHELAHKYANGRLIALGGGGYSYHSVPRCWTIILAEITGAEIQDEIPSGWQKIFKHVTGLDAPTTIHDKKTPILSQSDKDRISRLVSESVSQVQNFVFPIHGLDNT